MLKLSKKSHGESRRYLLARAAKRKAAARPRPHADEAIPVMQKVTIAFLTSRIRGIPTEIRLGPEDGMPRECAVSFDNVRAVPKVLLSDPMTSLAGKRMHEVCKALAIATGCD